MNGAILIIKRLRLYEELFTLRAFIQSSISEHVVTSSLFDSQVQYYEPAKQVAKLRDPNLNKVLFRINLIGGHGGLRRLGIGETSKI